MAKKQKEEEEIAALQKQIAEAENAKKVMEEQKNLAA